MALDEGHREARILVVDDEPANVKLLERILRSAGYQRVWGTTDPLEACRLCRVQGFELVLLDLRMPRTDGFQVLEILNAPSESPRRAPAVLVLTAENDPQARRRALQAGAGDFLGKPYERLDLLSRVQTLLEARRRGAADPPGDGA